MKKTLLQEEFELKVAKLQVHAQRVQHVLAHFEELKNKDCFDWENVGDLDHLNRQFINMFNLDEFPNQDTYNDDFAPFGLDTFQPERVKI